MKCRQVAQQMPYDAMRILIMVTGIVVDIRLQRLTVMSERVLRLVVRGNRLPGEAGRQKGRQHHQQHQAGHESRHRGTKHAA